MEAIRQGVKGQRGGYGGYSLGGEGLARRAWRLVKTALWVVVDPMKPKISTAYIYGIYLTMFLRHHKESRGLSRLQNNVRTSLFTSPEDSYVCYKAYKRVSPLDSKSILGYFLQTCESSGLIYFESIRYVVPKPYAVHLFTNCILIIQKVNALR